MLRSLDITNFQSHKHSHLEFSPGVNVIIGQTDSGKSSIIRALRLVKENRPAGDSYKSYWGGNTVVTIETETDIIARKKEGAENIYQLNDMIFRAFGQDVPAEIRSALNMDDVNLQRQMDNVFLLSNTPGEIAQHFNRIARLDKIDIGTKNVNARIRDISTKIKFKEGQIEEDKKKLKQFPDLQKLESEIEVLEGLERKAITNKNTITKLTSLITQINETQQEIKQMQEGVLLLEGDVNAVIVIQGKQEIVKNKITSLSAFIKNIKQIKNDITQCETILPIETILNDSLQLMQTKQRKEQDMENLSKLMQQIAKLQTKIKEQNMQLQKSEKTWHAEMPEICPLCGK